jgi:hypothetical protein
MDSLLTHFSRRPAKVSSIIWHTRARSTSRAMIYLYTGLFAPTIYVYICLYIAGFALRLTSVSISSSAGFKKQHGTRGYCWSKVRDLHGNHVCGALSGTDAWRSDEQKSRSL